VDLLYAGLLVRWFEEYKRKEMIAADIGFLKKLLRLCLDSHDCYLAV
jgi:hypothetical protein